MQQAGSNRQSRRRPPPNPRPGGGGHECERAPVVVKCNVGRYHGTIVAQRTVFTAQRHASAVYAYAIIVSLPVCLSVISRCSTEMAKRRIMQRTPHHSSGTLVFCRRRSRQNSNRVTPNGGTKCRWGRLKFAIFDRRLLENVDRRLHSVSRKGTLLFF